MKRKNNLYYPMISYDNAYEVYNKIKCNTKNKSKVFKFSLNLNSNIFSILKSLYNKNYVFGKYNIFLIREPKYRIIMSEGIQDKIVNHLVSNHILLPSTDYSLIDSNVATRVDKGSKYAYDLFLKYVKKLIRSNKSVYVLKLDISKYFYNIDHEVMMDMLNKKIKDKDALNILSMIINTTNESYINETINRLKENEIRKIMFKTMNENDRKKCINEIRSIPTYTQGKGLPIGNMSSQLLATFYLANVDRFIKERLGFKYYIRYMDDFVIIDTNRKKLQESISKIEYELKKYKLNLNRKTCIYDLDKGVNFIGYLFKIKNNKIYAKVSNKNYKRIKRKITSMKDNNDMKYFNSVASYNGLFKKCTWNIYSYFKDVYMY